MPAGENPVEVRIDAGILIDEREADPCSDMGGRAALDMIEAGGIATERAHDRARKEKARKRAPPRRIPAALEEDGAFGGWARGHERVDSGAIMRERQHMLAQETEIEFELACACEAMASDGGSSARPEALIVVVEMRGGAREQITSARRRSRAHELEVVIVAECGDCGLAPMEPPSGGGDLVRNRVGGRPPRKLKTAVSNLLLEARSPSHTR